MTLAAWLHDLSPILVKFTDTFAIRYYGLAYAIGFLLGWAWLRLMVRRGMTPLSPQRISDMMITLVLGVVVGGRLGYVLFYDPHLLIDFNSSFPFWGALRVNQGGMSSHGGILGVIASTWWVSRGIKDDKGKVHFKVPWLHVLDMAAVACTVGLMLGRVANFINGELLGAIAAPPPPPPPPGGQQITPRHPPPPPPPPPPHPPPPQPPTSASSPSSRAVAPTAPPSPSSSPPSSPRATPARSSRPSPTASSWAASSGSSGTSPGARASSAPGSASSTARSASSPSSSASPTPPSRTSSPPPASPWASGSAPR
jgi:hypothetical protein